MLKPVYFLNTYKTRHIMDTKIFYKLKEAKEASKDLSGNWAIVRLQQESEFSTGIKTTVCGNEEGIYYAKECDNGIQIKNKKIAL